MKSKYILIAISILFILGCSSIPRKDSLINDSSLALFKIKASGKYYGGVSFSMFGDEPLAFFLTNKKTGVVYQGKVVGKKYCAVANVPLGEYYIEEANSPARQPFVGTPVKVYFGGNRISVLISKPDVNYFGTYVIKTKQNGTSLALEELIYSEPTQNEYEEVETFFNKDHSDAGWHFNKP